MKARPETRVTIGGHADERGTREYNLALGERRASSSRDYLVAKGVNAAVFASFLMERNVQRLWGLRKQLAVESSV